MNTLSLAGVLNISNPYPAIDDINNARVVVITAITAEFPNERMNPKSELKRLVKFAINSVPNVNLPLVTSTDLLVALMHL